MRFKKITALLLAAALTITGIYIPADSEKAYASEIELTDNTDTVKAEESATGTETMKYVRSAKELVSALNGTTVSAANVRIQMEEAYNNTDDMRYMLEDGDVDLSKGIVLPEKTNITLDMYNYPLSLSDDMKQSKENYLKLIVPAGSTLTVTGIPGAVLPFEIDNRGTFEATGAVQIRPLQGNGVKNTGELRIEGSASISFDKQKENLTETAPINNIGGTVFVNTGREISAAISSSQSTSAIINKNGNVTLENGAVKNEGTNVSGNAILNQGSKAILEIRGGMTSESCIFSGGGCAVTNDGGKVSVLDGTRSKESAEVRRADICGQTVGILNYNGGALTMYGGLVYNLVSGGGAAVATTPYIVDYLTGTVSEGSVKVLEGSIRGNGAGNAGIAYSGSSLPVLLGGDVHGAKGAVVKYATKGTPANVEEYEFINAKQERVEAYYPAMGMDPASAMKEIYYGLTTNGMQTVSYDGVGVSDFAQLQNALAKGGKIKLENDINVTTSISMNDGTILYGDGRKLIFATSGLQLTIPKDAKVSIYGNQEGTNVLEFSEIAEKSAGIVNLGTLSMNHAAAILSSNGTLAAGRDFIQNSGLLYLTDSTVHIAAKGKSIEEPATVIHNNKEGKVFASGMTYIYSDSYIYSNVIFNEGFLELKCDQGLMNQEDSIHSGSVSGCGIQNTGTTVVDGYTIIASSGEKGIAVKNQGSFTMKNGEVKAERTSIEKNPSYAITYDDNHLPQLIGGRVAGSYYLQDSSTVNASAGSAVAQVTNWGTMETQMGYFVNPENKTISGHNSCLIRNGVPNADAKVNAKEDYLLMEKGEIISDSFDTLFEKEYAYTISNNVVITSTSENVVSVSRNSAGKWVASAVGVGMTMLRMELEEEGISDYIRVEVVEDRESLKSEDYQASILENNLWYNMYQTKMDIPLEWHLKSSYDITSGDSQMDTADTINPAKVIFESQDSDFAKYFEEESGITFSEIDKQYTFELRAKTDSPEKYNYLANGEINGFQGIRVKLVFEVNGRTEMVDAGTFDVLIDKAEPKFGFNQITLNSAYTTDAYFTYGKYSYVYPNKAKLINYSKWESCSVVNLSFPNGFVSPFSKGSLETIDYLSYTGIPKNASYSIPAQVYSEFYNGFFETKIPVKVISEKPKADVTVKKIDVAMTTADASDIPLIVCSGTKEGVASISKVEVVGNSSFAIANSSLDGYNNVVLKDKKYIQETEGGVSFYLQPRKNLKKAEKVTLKFTYEGVRGITRESKINTMGYDEPANYTTTTTVNIVPRELKKASMKLETSPVTMVVSGKKTQAGKVEYDQKNVFFQTTPANYDGGYFVVSSLNGTGLDADKVWKNKDGEYSFQLYVKENAKPGKQKISVIWYDKDGKPMGKPLSVPVKLIKNSEFSIPDKNVKLDYNDLSKMSAKVKWKKTADWTNAESLNPGFEMTKVNDSSFTLTANMWSIDDGTVLPGKTYPVDICVYSTYGESRIETLQVKVEDIKEIKVNASNTYLYKNAPGEQCFLYFNTQKPNYGMSIVNVEITDKNTPFEVRAIRGVGNYSPYQATIGGQDTMWTIAYKNNRYNSSVIGKQKVKLEVTYQNGKKAATETTVSIQ